jgi:hypothetical protein
MTTTPQASLCWCCDSEFDEENLVRLRARPEVGICLACARDLQVRAAERHDQLNPSWPGRLRSVLRGAREAVIRRGWHDRPIIGRILRGIDRFLP